MTRAKRRAAPKKLAPTKRKRTPRAKPSAPAHPFVGIDRVIVTVRWTEQEGKRAPVERSAVRLGRVLGNAGNMEPPWRWVAVGVPGVEKTVYPIEDVRDAMEPGR